MKTILPALAGIWKFANDEGLLRQIVVAVSIWMTWESFVWATGYAERALASPSYDAAALIAAVLVPVVAFQKFVFEWWSKGKGE